MKIHRSTATCVAFVAACSTTSYRSTNNEHEEAVGAAASAIEFCVEQFELRAGKKISRSINQVAPIVAIDKIDMMFTDGETGDFGVRSPQLHPYFSCGVVREDPLRLYFMLDVEAGSLIPLGPTDVSQKQIVESEYTQPIWHLLFLRRGEQFKYSKLKKFDRTEFENVVDTKSAHE